LIYAQPTDVNESIRCELTNTACETSSGQYSNTVKNTFDYVQKWINARL
jgi:hypothetical protein